MRASPSLWFRPLWLAVIITLAIAIPTSRSGNTEQNTPVAGTVAPWQDVVDGIAYAEFFSPIPNHIYVTRMERNNPRVTLESSIAQGRLSGGLETVREMAGRYDQSINYWDGTWGARSQVIAAINGSFYDPETGIPWSGQVQSGWYAKQFEDLQNGSGFAWTLERGAFIGECVSHTRNKQLIKFITSDESMPFDGINIPRGENKLIIYTPQYDSRTWTSEDGIEVLVELSRPLMIMPAPAMITGTVRAIYDGQGSTWIPFDHVVLSASGRARDELRSRIIQGAEIGFSQEIRHLTLDCRKPLSLSWTKTYASVATSFYFLKDGAIQKMDELGAVLRTPRTAIAFNDRYIFFIVIDGRDTFQSRGMSMVELAVFARNTLGATAGVALDGGGSSTMVVNGRLKNRPNTDVQDPNTATGKVERAVANGMMMVTVLPMKQSTQFAPGDRVNTVNRTDIAMRLGPGTNYAILATLPPQSTGFILDHPMNGVLATNTNWWKVSFGDLQGWVSEKDLAK